MNEYIQKNDCAHYWTEYKSPWDSVKLNLNIQEIGYTDSKIISMESLGKHGRWGNTIFQYIYLRVFADIHNFKVETPNWLGQLFFKINAPPLPIRKDIVLLDNVSLIFRRSYPWSPGDYHRARSKSIINDRKGLPYVLNHPLLSPQMKRFITFTQFDIEGLFIINTRYYADFKEKIRDFFKLNDEMRKLCDEAVERLNKKGSKIIGVHLRKGDFRKISLIKHGFEFDAPIHWYTSWLDTIWSKFKDPVLLLCSDSPDIKRAFLKYKPITTADFASDIIDTLRMIKSVDKLEVNRDASFFLDWYLLTQCHAMAISNSTFSFSASMMNRKAKIFMRPCLTKKRLAQYAPWNSEPVLFPPREKYIFPWLRQEIKLSLMSQGYSILPLLIFYILIGYVSLLVLRIRACFKANGFLILCKEIMSREFYINLERKY